MKKKFLIILALFSIFIVGIFLGAATCSIMKAKLLKGKSLAYYELGHESFQKGNYLKAIAYFNRAVALDQKSFFPRIFLPKAYLSAGYYQLALEEYQTTLDLAEREKWSEAEIRFIRKYIEDIRKHLSERQKK